MIRYNYISVKLNKYYISGVGDIARNKKMYKSKSTLQKIKTSFGPLLFWIIIIILISGLGYFTFLIYRARISQISDLDKYAEYIYDYARNSQKITDTVASVKLDSYELKGKALDTYAVDSNGDPVLNYKWDTHAEAFLDVIRILQDIATLSANPKSQHYKSKRIWEEVLPDFVEQVSLKLPSEPLNMQTPWGTNWYQFSITYPLFLTIICYTYRRIFNTSNSYFESSLALYIEIFFQNPDTVSGVMSMGWRRDGPNAVMMAVPYIGGKLLMKTLNRNDNICQYVNNYTDIPLVTTGEGLYPDLGYVFHTVLRAFGYIYSSINDFKVIASFFDRDISILYDIYRRVEHPDIPFHFSPLFTRSSSCTSGVNGDLGFEVMTSIRAGFVKRPEWYLTFYGQKKNLCFYESDKANDTWGQIWISARVFFYKDSLPEWQREFIPYYSGVITFENEVKLFQTTTTTTTVFMPSAAHTMLCRFDDAIGMRNSFSISYGDYIISVLELFLADKDGYHVFYKITPSDENDKNIHIGVNLGQFVKKVTSGVGLGVCYKYSKFNSFIYNNDAVESSVKNTKTNEMWSTVQVVPRSKNGVYMTGFSNLHLDVNTCRINSENKIETTTHLLYYDEKFPNNLLLFNKTTNECAVSQYYEEYTSSVEISSKYITQTFDDPDILKGFDIYLGNIVKKVDMTGPQIILKTLVPSTV